MITTASCEWIGNLTVELSGVCTQYCPSGTAMTGQALISAWEHPNLIPRTRWCLHTHYPLFALGEQYRISLRVIPAVGHRVVTAFGLHYKPGFQTSAIVGITLVYSQLKVFDQHGTGGKGPVAFGGELNLLSSGVVRSIVGYAHPAKLSSTIRPKWLIEIIGNARRIGCERLQILKRACQRQKFGRFRCHGYRICAHQHLNTAIGIKSAGRPSHQNIALTVEQITIDAIGEASGDLTNLINIVGATVTSCGPKPTAHKVREYVLANKLGKQITAINTSSNDSLTLTAWIIPHGRRRSTDDIGRLRNNTSHIAFSIAPLMVIASTGNTDFFSRRLANIRYPDVPRCIIVRNREWVS